MKNRKNFVCNKLITIIIAEFLYASVVCFPNRYLKQIKFPSIES
jgi:hypothetical protein